MQQRDHKSPPRHGINIPIVHAVGGIDPNDGGEKSPCAKGAGRQRRHLRGADSARPAVYASGQVEIRTEVGLDCVEDGQRGDLFAGPQR